MTKIIFTDLDGTLLDPETYSWEAARPALGWLKEHGVPWVMVTSKTRTEVQDWRRILGNVHPFVVENGGAIFIPRHYFKRTICGAARRDGYEVIERGKPYAEVVLGLAVASRASGCRLRAFQEMTARDVAVACHLPLDLAVLAKQREYDESFQPLDAERAGELEAAIQAQGLQCIRGGRFHHVCGHHNKADAVRQLVTLFRHLHGQVNTIGLGDSFNDVALLQTIDVPVIVRSRDVSTLLQRIPNAFVTDHEGPEGWNEAILDIFRNHDNVASSGGGVSLRT
jgi:mannosyl-3-phosphoglycerate phosphatase